MPDKTAPYFSLVFLVSLHRKACNVVWSFQCGVVCSCVKYNRILVFDYIRNQREAFTSKQLNCTYAGQQYVH